jgi:hypothetical protein
MCILYTSHVSHACYFANPSNLHQSDNLNNYWINNKNMTPYNFTNVQYSVYLTPQREYFSVVVISSEKLTCIFHTKYGGWGDINTSKIFMFLKSENNFHSMFQSWKCLQSLNYSMAPEQTSMTMDKETWRV